MNSDGSGRTAIASSPQGDYDPAWSPDGRRIVFESSRETPSSLYLVNADGTNVTKITSPPVGFYDTYPSFSPDGSRIVFCRFDQYRITGKLYSVAVDGTDLKGVGNLPGDSQYPNWR